MVYFIRCYDESFNLSMFFTKEFNGSLAIKHNQVVSLVSVHIPGAFKAKLVAVGLNSDYNTNIVNNPVGIMPK